MSVSDASLRQIARLPPHLYSEPMKESTMDREQNLKTPEGRTEKQEAPKQRRHHTGQGNLPRLPSQALQRKGSYVF